MYIVTFPLRRQNTPKVCGQLRRFIMMTSSPRRVSIAELHRHQKMIGTLTRESPESKSPRLHKIIIGSNVSVRDGKSALLKTNCALLGNPKISFHLIQVNHAILLRVKPASSSRAVPSKCVMAKRS